LREFYLNFPAPNFFPRKNTKGHERGRAILRLWFHLGFVFKVCLSTLIG
jgi:hypothetical protein